MRYAHLLPHFLKIVSLLQRPRNCIGDLGRGEGTNRRFIAVTAFQEEKYRHEASSLDGGQMGQHRLAGGFDERIGGGCHDAARCRMPTSTKQVILQRLPAFYESTGQVLTSNSWWRCDPAKLIKRMCGLVFRTKLVIRFPQMAHSQPRSLSRILGGRSDVRLRFFFTKKSCTENTCSECKSIRTQSDL